MNNLQFVVKDNSRHAMHVAVELCEQGDFDSVTDAFRWLMQERDDSELGSGACEVECFDDGVDEGMDGKWFSYAPPTWYLSCGHTAQGTEMPNFCPVCGKVVKR